MFVPGIRLAWGCPAPTMPDEGLLGSLIHWALGIYLSHPIMVPLVGGAMMMMAGFAMRNLFKKAVVASWRGVAWLVRTGTWPVRKAYAWTFASKGAVQKVAPIRGGRLPIIGEKAYFGPDHTTGLKERRLVMVTGAHGGFYRGHCLTTGAQVVCSPDRAEAV